MGIVDEDIARVRDQTDMVALVSEKVALKRVGQRYSGLCPFHQEKTPSFSVNPELHLFHCFGCGKSGDPITWVRETDGLDFVDDPNDQELAGACAFDREGQPAERFALVSRGVLRGNSVSL